MFNYVPDVFRAKYTGDRGRGGRLVQGLREEPAPTGSAPPRRGGQGDQLRGQGRSRHAARRGLPRCLDPIAGRGDQTAVAVDAPSVLARLRRPAPRSAGCSGRWGGRTREPRGPCRGAIGSGAHPFGRQRRSREPSLERDISGCRLVRGYVTTLSASGADQWASCLRLQRIAPTSDDVHLRSSPMTGGPPQGEVRMTVVSPLSATQSTGRHDDGGSTTRARRQGFAACADDRPPSPQIRRGAQPPRRRSRSARAAPARTRSCDPCSSRRPA